MKATRRPWQETTVKNIIDDDVGILEWDEVNGYREVRSVSQYQRRLHKDTIDRSQRY
jgi:hypothetical protein